jgi:hypothetical protein
MAPHIVRYLKNAFRGLNSDARAEAVQEGLANALVAYRRLWLRGKSNLAFPTVLARYAAAQVRAGRQVAERLNVRDVTSRYCQHRTGVRVERLDRYDPKEECWQEIIVEDHRAGPAETAAMRIDFATFLRSLTRYERKLALKLAQGESTSAAASRLGISAGRVSQIRRALHDKWRQFQGDASTLRSAAA